ncbi:MAG: cytosolic protein [Planctomycetes bacterium]|nr:cytosolic protein [Planctomycetota bacterium]
MAADNAWKDILERNFEDFLAFFFPAAHAAIDWSRGVEFLDKELEAIAPGGKTGPRVVDKLAKVFLRRPIRGRAEAWFLVHVEVDGRAGPDLDERMHVYDYRIFDRHRRQVVGLAVLTEAGARARHGVYERGLFGYGNRFTFRVVKLSEHRDRREELERSANPFALVVLAHLEKREAHTDRDRQVVKLRMLRRLLERKLKRRDIMALFRFMDWLLALPENLEKELDSRVEALRQEKRMPYLARFERKALERGQRKVLLESIELGLNLRFGREGLALVPRIREIEALHHLRALLRALFKAKQIDGVKRALGGQAKALARRARR